MALTSECFPTTSWNLVVAASEAASRESGEALAQLCEAYWHPLYAYVRRAGHGVDESRDLTQEFFARLIEKHYLRTADRDRGRFRTYLLAALKHFLSNEWDRARAVKRGGGSVPIPLDLETGEHLYQREPADPMTPEKIYERRWALTLLDRAMTRLRGEFAAGGKSETFNGIQQFLTGDNQPGAYAQAAPALGMTAGALKVAVHRARRRFAGLVREEVAATLDRVEDTDNEIHYLLAAL
jgi:RNA polymerase sigma-70 factor (ECF subfamily)